MDQRTYSDGITDILGVDAGERGDGEHESLLEGEHVAFVCRVVVQGEGWY